MIISIQIEVANLQDALKLLTAPTIQTPEIMAGSKPQHSASEPTPPPSTVSNEPEPSAPIMVGMPEEITPSATEEPAYTLPEVRSILGELRRAKGAAEAKAILQKHNASSLGELPEEAYAAVVSEAREAMQ